MISIRIAAACLLVAGLWSCALAQPRVADESPAESQEPVGVVWERLWEESDEHFHQGEFERCVEIMRQIVEIAPDDYEAYSVGSWLMENDFRDAEAEAFLRKGLDNNPDAYDMYFYLGYFLYMHERYSEAAELLETAASFDCPFFVRHVLAHAYELAGRTSDSLQIWLEMESIEPESGVPGLQIDRIMCGKQPTDVPARVQRSREERKAREGREQDLP